MQPKVLFLYALAVFTVNAGEDVEDLIEKGYTCSLATANEEKSLNEFPGVRIVCDDGFCSKCVKTDEGVNVLYKRDDIDVEDYLRDGFVCSEEAHNAPDAHAVCDDGVCFGCRKPVWRGGRGDVEHYLALGFKCFLVNDVPQYALAENVNVVCDDGDCFGCLKIDQKKPIIKKLTLDQYLDQGYSCTITRNSADDADNIVCEDGKCFSCSRVESESFKEYPVTRKFLDQAEDFLEDGYKCGLLPHHSVEIQNDILCTGGLCLDCWQSTASANSRTKSIDENLVDKAEKLMKSGLGCSVVLEIVKQDDYAGVKTLCGEEACFICRE